MIKAVIVDDVLQAQDALQRDLETYCPDVKVIGRATGVVTGAKLLKRLSPDVLFLDIELEDGTGFDLLEILPEISFKIIFSTASDQHALQAFRFSAIDYLLKPIDGDLLKEAVSKIGTSDSAEKVEVLLDHWTKNNQNSRIALHSSDKIEIVTIESIVRCESENNYTTFYFKDGTNFLVSKTLKSYESLLAPLGFIRVHQSHLINIQEVKSYVKSEGGYLVMKDGQIVPVAVRKKGMVIQALESL